MCKINFEEFKKEIPKIFVQVKRDVMKITGKQRAGLCLGLVEMGMYQGGFIGGMHFAPGSDIVMNKTPLKILIEQQPNEILWAYTYHILLDLYLSSLGVLNEQKRRVITLTITEAVFKEEDHPAVIFARKGIGSFFPNLKLIYAPPDLKPNGIAIEYIDDFDRESYDYYS
ncbi:MAG: hypothetical protein ACW96X_01130 [Promethearchaeota archaeon]